MLDKEDGYTIIKDVRKEYGTVKPINKIYILDKVPQCGDEQLLEKAKAHNDLLERNIDEGEYRKVKPALYVTNPSFQMAKDAMSAVKKLDYMVCIGGITMSLKNYGSHCFCVVNYKPHDGSPLHVQNMAFDEKAEGALVIDPWLNVSCKFAKYRKEATDKFIRWSDRGKRINRFTPHNPISVSWSGAFFLGTLKFFDVYQPPEVPTRGTKPATQI